MTAQAALDTIESTEITTADVSRAAEYVEGFANTTAALTAISTWLQNHGDDRGANLLLAFALDKFAPHEASTM
jgi:hypothetical protein